MIRDRGSANIQSCATIVVRYDATRLSSDIDAKLRTTVSNISEGQELSPRSSRREFKTVKHALDIGRVFYL